MTNKSIYDAFERMWQHIVALLGNKQNYFVNVTLEDGNTTLATENNLLINTDSGFVVNSNDGVSLVDNGEGISLTASNGFVNIESNEANINTTGIISLNTEDAIGLNSTGEGISIKATNGFIDMQAEESVNIQSHNNVINITTDIDEVSIRGGMGVFVNSDSTIELSGGEILIDGGDGAVDIQTTDEIYINGNIGTYISNVATPINARDAANKDYVDTTIKNFLVVSSAQPNAADYPEGALWICPQA